MGLPSARPEQICLGIPKFLLLVTLGVLLGYLILGKGQSAVKEDLDLGEKFITETREAMELTDSWAADEGIVATDIPSAHSQDLTEPSEDVINVLHVYSKAAGNVGLQKKFQVCVTSMLRLTESPVNYHLIGDKSSLKLAISQINSVGSANVRIFTYDIDTMGDRVRDGLGRSFLDHFRYKSATGGNSGSYYGQHLFFLSILYHDLMPRNLDRIVVLDVDLKFVADVKLLWRQFERFNSAQMIGIAREQQPVYRHVFSQYRKANPKTKVGDPPPNGLTGFNSGVMLMDLAKIRKSSEYAELLSNLTIVDSLVAETQFKGHLGDQDFYTLIAMRHQEFFYILPCQWNRQLCSWWRKNGYEEVFDSYFHCPDPIRLYHGNCNTPIPE